MKISRHTKENADCNTNLKGQVPLALGWSGRRSNDFETVPWKLRTNILNQLLWRLRSATLPYFFAALEPNDKATTLFNIEWTRNNVVCSGALNRSYSQKHGNKNIGARSKTLPWLQGSEEYQIVRELSPCWIFPYWLFPALDVSCTGFPHTEFSCTGFSHTGFSPYWMFTRTGFYPYWILKRTGLLRVLDFQAYWIFKGIGFSRVLDFQGYWMFKGTECSRVLIL